MILELSTQTPWNANYCTEHGQVIYKVDAGAPTIGARHIKISKIVAPELDPNADHVDEDAFRDVFEPLGEVEYHTIRNSRIIIGDINESIGKFFSKNGWGFYGRTRIFTGPDGKEYAWKLTMRVPKLFLKGTDVPVAIFHRHRMGIVNDARPASLEIFEEGMHMIDLIVITFVYIEKLRRERERGATKNPGAGGGGL